MIHTDHNDPAFRYEGLARVAFDNCEKYGDPFGIAAQDVYNNFVPEPTLNGKKALSKVLSKIIIDNTESEHNDALIQLEESIWSSETQQQIITIIDTSIDILNQIHK
ncbi:conserved hypothetical protein [Tenacibaculum sp. 190524A05c]|uniref:hypothetical protein n=1 Tax=Tenacibaculum platacis TaxID=3137852 RepID=UPI0031FB18C8